MESKEDKVTWPQRTALRKKIIESVEEAPWHSQVKQRFVEQAQVYDINGKSPQQYAQHVIDTVMNWPGVCDQGRRDYLNLIGLSPRMLRGPIKYRTLTALITANQTHLDKLPENRDGARGGGRAIIGPFHNTGLAQSWYEENVMGDQHATLFIPSTVTRDEWIAMFDSAPVVPGREA